MPIKTVFSDRQLLHRQHREFFEGALVEGFEHPDRALHILKALRDANILDLIEPNSHDLAIARLVHDEDYLHFLSTAYREWSLLGRNGTALPYSWYPKAHTEAPIPTNLDGQLGYYASDTSTGFVEGTYHAVVASYECALTAAEFVIGGANASFALCRPPGHHASRASTGGYCFINNAACAATRLRNGGIPTVAILDIDYHHGNGTQAIFYDRPDVLVVNIHADPKCDYPFFSGHADETGSGDGTGFNVNLPLPLGVDRAQWLETLDHACERVAAFRPDVLIVSLGVDTYENDPISKFRLKGSDYPLIGARIAMLGYPTVFIMEGGYAIDEIGVNVASVLKGFDTNS